MGVRVSCLLPSLKEASNRSLPRTRVGVVPPIGSAPRRFETTMLVLWSRGTLVANVTVMVLTTLTCVHGEEPVASSHEDGYGLLWPMAWTRNMGVRATKGTASAAMPL